MRFRSPASKIAFTAVTLWLAAAASAANAPGPGGQPSGAATPSAQDTMGQAVPGMSNPEANALKPTDGGIVSAVMAFDSNMISAANATDKKKMGKEAKSFAHILYDQHKRDLEKYKKLVKKQKLTPTESEAVKEMRARGAENEAALAGKEGKDFEQAYVEAMLKSHMAAMEILDRQLIPNAEDGELKKQLTDTRAHEAVHIEKAKRLQANVASKEE